MVGQQRWPLYLPLVQRHGDYLHNPMNTLEQEIEAELTTFKGTTFSSPEEADEWIRAAMRRIAEKTIAETIERVDERNPVTRVEDWLDTPTVTRSVVVGSGGKGVTVTPDG